MASYEVAFSGQLVPGAQLEAVKANLAKLFQADAQRIAVLFSGRRIVIKNGLDAEAAEKYRLAMSRAGALAEITPMLEAAEQAPPAAVAAPQSLSSAAAVDEHRRRLQVAPRDEYMAAFAEVDAPDFGMAPLGDDLQDDKPEAPQPSLDLSQFSLAPVGSDMGQAREAPPAPAPDVSHLKLVD